MKDIDHIEIGILLIPGEVFKRISTPCSANSNWIRATDLPAQPTAQTMIQVTFPDLDPELWRMSRIDRSETNGICYLIVKQALAEETTQPQQESSQRKPETKARILAFGSRYGFALAIFLWGFHLHAQVNELTPYWTEDRILHRYIEHPESQLVTARWMMLSGVVLGALVRARVLRLGK